MQTVVIQLNRSRFYVVDAPPTGFKSTPHLKDATVFKSLAHAEEFRRERGVMDAWSQVLTTIAVEGRHA